jgi:thioredoxin
MHPASIVDDPVIHKYPRECAWGMQQRPIILRVSEQRGDMREPIVLTDGNLDTVLNGMKPAVILFTTGEGIRGDFKTSFTKASNDMSNVIFATLDPSKNPQAAARFGVDEKPVLMAWYCGEEVARRSKPWGTDLQLALDMLENARKNDPSAAVEDEAELDETAVMAQPVLDKPVNVTDSSFEHEVLDASTELPVMIDFWAAWCGPCRMVAPILDKLSKEFAGKIKIAKVDVDANPRLSATFRIQSIPNLMIVKNRTIIFNQPGALPEPALRDLIQQAITLNVPAPTNAPKPAP